MFFSTLQIITIYIFVYDACQKKKQLYIQEYLKLYRFQERNTYYITQQLN